MNELRPENISVIDPINPAIDRAKLILFQPFDLGKWFVIGFCAFLANLGKGNGGGGGNGGNNRFNIHDGVNHAKDYVLYNLSWIIPLSILVILAIITIWLVVTWLSSRGRFMFLHCVAENKAEVKLPWAKFRDHANNLFAFRIVLGLIGFATIILPCLMIFGLAIMSPVIITVLGSVMISILIIAMIIALLLIAKFTTDFVVPIMFLRTTSCTAAWREFLKILSANKARFALYILFQIAIAIAIFAVVFFGFCIGLCLCCVSLLLILPYIGTVVLLPVHVFIRSYSLYYLQQFGPQYDVIRPEISEPFVQDL